MSWFFKATFIATGLRMRKTIKLTFGHMTLDVELLATATADAIWEALPFTSQVMTWGDEVYFATPVSVSRDAGARSTVEAGEIAYWPDGNAIAIGFGPTPISAPGEIRLASPCNIWAKALSDVKILKSVKAGTTVFVTAE
jgi:uncharacterized protein